MAGITFWVYGDNSDEVLQLELQSGGSLNNSWRTVFTIDFKGWQLITLPFAACSAQSRNFDFTAVTAWILILDNATTSFLMDDFALLPRGMILRDYQNLDTNKTSILPDNFLFLPLLACRPR